MKLNKSTVLFVLICSLAFLLVVFIASKFIKTDAPLEETHSGSSGVGITVTDEVPPGDSQSLEGSDIERVYKQLLDGYLHLDSEVIDNLAGMSAAQESEPSPFQRQLERLCADERVRAILAKAGAALRYDVVQTGYTGSGNGTYFVDLVVRYPDIGSTLQTHFVNTGEDLAYLGSDDIIEYLSGLDLAGLPRNAAYLYCYFERAVEGKWRLSSVSNLESSGFLPEFGGLRLYQYDEKQQDYPLYLPLGCVAEVSAEEFAQVGNDDQPERVPLPVQNYARACIAQFQTDLDERDFVGLFADNPGIIDADGTPFYLEDSQAGAELYLDYQTLEVDTEKARRAELFLSHANLETRYFRGERSGVTQFAILHTYSYVNRGILDKLLYTRTGKSLHSLSDAELSAFIDENREQVVCRTLSISTWTGNMALEPNRFLMSDLVTLISRMTFGR